MVVTTYVDFDQEPNTRTVFVRASDLMVAPQVYDTRRCAQLAHMLRGDTRLFIQQLDEVFPNVQPHLLTPDVRRWLSDIAVTVGHEVNDVGTSDGTVAVAGVTP